MIVKQIKAIRKMTDNKSALKYLVGESVSFKSKKGKIISGVIKNVNQKTLTLIYCDDGSTGWRMSFGLIL